MCIGSNHTQQQQQHHTQYNNNKNNNKSNNCRVTLYAHIIHIVLRAYNNYIGNATLINNNYVIIYIYRRPAAGCSFRFETRDLEEVKKNPFGTPPSNAVLCTQ